MITIGIAFHDEERVLGEAVESLLRQTHADFELLLVDDGSTDGSLAIASEFARDPRVRVVSDGARRRLPARLNEIVRSARGEFIARMDADDISHPERLTRELRLLESGGYDAVGTWAALIDERRRPFAVSEMPLTATPRAALQRGLLVHASMLGRTAWFRANPYDEMLSRAEDRDLWCRTVGTSRFGVVPEPLYIVRVSPRTPEFLSDYRESQRQNRILFRRYGPSVLGLPRTASVLVGSVAKTVAMSAALRFGLADRLVRRRGRPPTSDELRLIDEALSLSPSPIA